MFALVQLWFCVEVVWRVLSAATFIQVSHIFSYLVFRHQDTPGRQTEGRMHSMHREGNR